VLTGCSVSEKDPLADIEESARTGIWVAPYAFHYRGEVGIRSAVRPFAEVDGEFNCSPVGRVGEASARLYVIEDGGLVELQQPEIDNHLIRKYKTIGRETVHCLAFDDRDIYQTVQGDGSTHEIPTAGFF